MKQAEELLAALRNFVQAAHRTLDEGPHATIHIPTVGDGGLNISVANLDPVIEQVTEVLADVPLSTPLAAKEKPKRKRK